MIPTWLNQKIVRKKFSVHLSWSCEGWEIRRIRASKIGTEGVEYENVLLDPFLKKKKKSPEFPEVALSSSQICFSSFWRHVILIILVHPLDPLLTIHLIWDVCKSKKQKASWLGTSKKDLVFVCYHCCGVQKTIETEPQTRWVRRKAWDGGVRVGVGTAFDHKPWTVRAGRNLSHLAQLPHFIDKKNKVSRVKEPARGWAS